MSTSPKLRLNAGEKCEKPTKRASAPVRRPSGSAPAPGRAGPLRSVLGVGRCGILRRQTGLRGILRLSCSSSSFWCLEAVCGLEELAMQPEQPQTFDKPLKPSPPAPRARPLPRRGWQRPDWLVCLPECRLPDPRADIFHGSQRSRAVRLYRPVTIVTQMDRFRGGIRAARIGYATRRYWSPRTMI
jgi:hypothetical protein